MENKDENIDVLSLEEDEFMLNDKKIEEPVVQIDDIIDTPEEKDLQDGIELEKEIQKQQVEEENISSDKEKTEKKAKEKRKNKKEKKVVSKKVFYTQVIFCSLSAIFILGCIIFYGTRALKYYKIYNPKTENGEAAVLLGTSISTNSSVVTEGEGLYRVSGSFLYKGKNVDNYVIYNNSLWRIMKVNSDGSLDMVNDSFVNGMDWNSEIVAYKDSDIRKYLNDEYLKTLNKDLLTTTTFCLDTVNELGSITCNESNSEDYVRLLSATEFLNSQVDGQTFLSSNDENVWLYNNSDDAVWYTNGINISKGSSTLGYLVKPVVHVKNSAALQGGNGTKEDPYIIEKSSKEITNNSYIKLGDDIWIVYEKNDDTVKLALTKLLDLSSRFSFVGNTFNVEESNSIANYLNTTYLNNLPYKDKLLDTTWYSGAYTKSYKDVLTSTVTSKVGLLNVLDVKQNNIDITNSYYLMTPGDANYAYMQGNALRQSKVTINRGVKPTISIKITNIESGKGIYEDPYVMEG